MILSFSSLLWRAKNLSVLGAETKTKESVLLGFQLKHQSNNLNI